MDAELWSPWKVWNPPLQSHARRAELIWQRVNVEYLLGTTLHPEARKVLRGMHGDICLELDGVNDNGQA